MVADVGWGAGEGSGAKEAGLIFRASLLFERFGWAVELSWTSTKQMHRQEAFACKLGPCTCEKQHATGGDAPGPRDHRGMVAIMMHSQEDLRTWWMGHHLTPGEVRHRGEHVANAPRMPAL